MSEVNNDFKLDRLVSFITTEELQEDEIFKEITDTEGRYFISNYGRVLSTCHTQAKILKCQICGKGYLYIDIDKKHKTIHRLVASAFLFNADDTRNIVHHKDGNKQNNNLINLQWVTASENRQEYIKFKRNKSI